MNNAMLWLCLLSLSVIVGLVGMLLSSGLTDRLMFVLAALPVLIGVWRWWRLRQN